MGLISALLSVPCASADDVLVAPLKTLFSHERHLDAFKRMDRACTSCHSFSIQSQEKGPTAEPVPSGLLKAPVKSCHECHVEKIALARPNQCVICHGSTKKIQPKDHEMAWKERHGRMAQLDSEGCRKCHTPVSCDRCHAQRDSMNPNVHPGNFRLFHSIQARGNPASCLTCHRSQQFCLDCHTKRGGR